MISQKKKKYIASASSTRIAEQFWFEVLCTSEIGMFLEPLLLDLRKNDNLRYNPFLPICFLEVF